MKIHETHIVPAISNKIRLQEYGVSIFHSITTRSGIKKAIKKGLILIEGKKAKTADWISEGQQIDLLKPNLPGKKIFKLNFDVLYEDEEIGIIHKPAGFPTSGNYFKTIENALLHNLSLSKAKDALIHPLPAHRLDNPTSGILICAKTKKSLIKLQQDFAEKKIGKTYFAIVQGKLNSFFEMNSEVDGKDARTKIKSIKNYTIDGADYTLVELNPLTGRTHQLRIHLRENNSPIIGDEIYGKEENGYFKNKSLFLFAGKISVEHPVSKKEMNFELQLPKRFRNLDYYRID